MDGGASGAVGLLRFLTCGSVDDGKSTLIGRLLVDTGSIPEDQAAALKRDSARHGTTGAEPDVALLLDGLEAEREQGITIDVAYRYFGTARRRFIIADAPGHEQYTRNMATAASQAELAVVLIDARHGIRRQTRRHSFIAALMGVRHVVLAVNKMDLVGYDRTRFEALAAEYALAIRTLGFASCTAIPLSARAGENVIAPSAAMPWYRGPSLLDCLEAIPLGGGRHTGPLRMPVQIVLRKGETRHYAGTVAQGTVAAGDVVRALPSHETARVASVIGPDGIAIAATAETPASLSLDRDLDISRGDVIVSGDPPAVRDGFVATLVWLDGGELFPGRGYVFKIGTANVPGAVARIESRVDPDSFATVPASSLRANDIARVQVALGRAVAVEPFENCPELGGFIMLDRQSGTTVAAGRIEPGLPTSADVRWHDFHVDAAARAALKRQTPLLVWFTGLSGSGKSTIAGLVEQQLHALGRHTMMLDGDNLRHGLTRDLGFSEADRVENIRRAAEAARLLMDAGLIVLVALISPYRNDRAAARERTPAGRFVEVFVDTPIEDCRRRDPKGLYARADAGLIRNFTGVDAPYEPPEAPELHLRASDGDAATLAQRVVALIENASAAV